jgi:DNA-binding NarL/FixJ family response regulator
MKITIVLADDHELVRRGISSLLETQPDFEIVSECSNGRDLLELVGRLRPHVALVDVAMPELNGIESTRRIRVTSPQTRVIAVSSYSDPEYVRGVFEAGAVGYVLKSGTLSDLIYAIRTANRNNPYFSPSLPSFTLVASYADNVTANASHVSTQHLSPRELETLQLLAEGHTSRDIASRLGIAESTVKTHRKNIKEKLAIHDTPGLTKYALKIGLIRS